MEMSTYNTDISQNTFIFSWMILIVFAILAIACLIHASRLKEENYQDPIDFLRDQHFFRVLAGGDAYISFLGLSRILFTDRTFACMIFLPPLILFFVLEHGVEEGSGGIFTKLGIAIFGGLELYCICVPVFPF